MRKKIKRLLEREVMTVEQAAEEYLLTANLIRLRIKRGTLPYVLKERKHFLDREDVEAIKYGERLKIEDEHEILPEMQ